MKNIFVFCGLFFVGCLLSSSPVFASSCHSGCGVGHGEGEQKHEKKSEKKIETKESVYSKIYVCPMHPEVKSDKPGKCPECGMKLEKKKILMTNACPEKDCEYQKAKPGKCSQHGKKLIKTEVKQVNPEELKVKPVKH